MTKKGITIWEQHLERIVLGAAIVFFLGFGAWQFTRTPNTSDGLAPADVEQAVERAEEQLNNALNAPVDDMPTYESAVDGFRSRLSDGLGDSRPLFALAPKTGLGGGSGGEEAGEILYVEPSLAAPTRVAVRTDYDALADEVVSELPELGERFPERPYDLGWTTVSAVVDLAGLRDEIGRPGSGDREAIPENWYEGRVDIVDVRIERSELVAGEWTDPVVVGMLPGGITFRELVETNLPASRDMIREGLADSAIRQAIVQPEFLPTANATWSAPDPLASSGDDMMAGLDEEELKIAELEARLMSDTRELTRALDDLSELGGEDPREGGDGESPGGGVAPGGDSGAPSFGGGEGGGRRAGGSRRSAPGSGVGQSGGGGGQNERAERERQQQAEREEERRQRAERKKERDIRDLSRRILTLDRRIERTKRELVDLGVDPDAAVGEVEAEVVDPFAADELAVWGFDIDVAYGSVYRYRVAVEVFNPFFRRKLDLSEAQHDLAESMGLVSSYSDWSEPVEMLRPTSFFLTRADPDEGVLGLGMARAEVFRFFDGRWWREEFTVEPGDVIGGLKRTDRRLGDNAPGEIDYGTGWYVVEINEGDDGRAGDEGGGRVVVQRIDSPDFVEDRTPGDLESEVQRRGLLMMVDRADASMEGG